MTTIASLYPSGAKYTPCGQPSFSWAVVRLSLPRELEIGLEILGVPPDNPWQNGHGVFVSWQYTGVK